MIATALSISPENPFVNTVNGHIYDPQESMFSASSDERWYEEVNTSMQSYGRAINNSERANTAALYGLAKAYLNTGEVDKAIEMANTAHSHTPQAHKIKMLLIEAYYSKGDAESAHRIATSIKNIVHATKEWLEWFDSWVHRTKNAPIDLANLAYAQHYLGRTYHAQGKHVEAELLFKSALAIMRERSGEEKFLYKYFNDLAGLYADQGKYVLAEPLYRQALSIQEKVYGRDHPDVAAVLERLEKCSRAIGELNEAEEYATRALQIRSKQN